MTSSCSLTIKSISSISTKSISSVSGVSLMASSCSLSTKFQW